MPLEALPFDLIKVVPYILVLVLALCGLNVFLALTIGIFSAGLVGIFSGDLTVATFAQSVWSGFTSMNEVFFLTLLCGGMSLFDSLLHAFGTAGTGGFGIKADGLAGYNAYLQWVIAIFMLLFGVNFNLYYLLLIKRFRAALHSSELATYLIIVLVASGVITFNIYPLYHNVGEAVRQSVFQVASITTTTGYSTADFNLWPGLSKAILFMLMFVGGCAGSTAGGLKVSRVMLLFKSCTIEVKKMLRPRCVENVRLDGKPVDGQTVYNALTYFTFYIIIMLIAGLIVSLDGLDFTTNFTAALSCLSNVGPGLSLVGPTGSFAIFSPLSKIVLMICMLLGRLEIFPLLLFVPFTWRWK